MDFLTESFRHIQEMDEETEAREVGLLAQEAARLLSELRSVARGNPCSQGPFHSSAMSRHPLLRPRTCHQSDDQREEVAFADSLG